MLLYTYLYIYTQTHKKCTCCMATVRTSPCLLHGLHDGVLKIALGISEKKTWENAIEPWINHGKT